MPSWANPTLYTRAGYGGEASWSVVEPFRIRGAKITKFDFPNYPTLPAGWGPAAADEMLARADTPEEACRTVATERSCGRIGALLRAEGQGRWHGVAASCTTRTRAW